MYSQHQHDEPSSMVLQTPDSFECYLCGEKFHSEISKDIHMENCMTADGPNSLDSSYGTPIRAHLRHSPSHGWAYRSPPHLAHKQMHQKSDFSSAVGSRVEPPQPQGPHLTAPPLVPQDYLQSESSEEDMRKRIQYPPKPKYPISSPLTNNPQIAQYVGEGAKNQLFQNMNIQTTQFQPRFPQYPASAPPPPPFATAPFGYSRSSHPTFTPRAPPPVPESAPFISSQHPHTLVIRHSSDPRALDAEAKTHVPQDVPADIGSSKLVSHHYRRESSQLDGNSVQPVPRHNRPISNPPPPPIQTSATGPVGEVGKRGKFEVKLMWEKQQPTLEITLEYLDNVDTDQILLKWDSRREAFKAFVRLSPGEHTGSLAIPDSDLVVYEVKPFNVSQFSVSVQEIKLDLIDAVPRPNLPPEPVKRPLYSQIDVYGKHLTSNTGQGELDSHKYLPENRDDQLAHPKPFQIVREERRVIFPTSGVLRTTLPLHESLSLPQEQSIPQPAIRPGIAPAKNRDELFKQDISSPLSPPFQVTSELQRDQSVPRSTLAGQEGRNRVEFRIPSGDQPLPPPRSKPAATAGAFDKPREESDLNKQIEALKHELTNARAEKEESERNLGAEVRKWQNNYDNLYKLKQTRDNENDILNREIEQLKKQYVAAISQLKERSAGGDRVRCLEESTTALLREKEEAVKNREEARIKQQLAEKRNKELEGKIQDLLDETQKKIQNIQMERDSYKAAAYKYKTERDRIKLTHEGEKTAYEEVNTVHQQLRDDYEKKTADFSNQISILTIKLKQAEAIKFGNYTHNNNNNKDVTHTSSSNTEREPTDSMRSGLIDRGYLSLGSMEYEQKKGFEKGEYFSKEKSQDKRPVLAKKPSIKSAYELTSKINSDFSKPANGTAIREIAAPTEPPPAPPAAKTYLRKSSVHSRVQELEGRGAEVPKASPRYSRVQSSKVQGLEGYRPELLTSFKQKYTSLFYKTLAVNATRLSYLQKPESHLHKQVLVNVKGIYRLGSLQTIFSKKYGPPNKSVIIAGVKLEEAFGSTNGVFEGTRYFECEPYRGLFVYVEEVFINVA